MIIKCLIENTTLLDDYATEHGLCLYIETNHHKLLFDFGASPLFVKNAKALDVDLAMIDTGILSHGHYDHGGGLKSFLRINDFAKVCVNKYAFDKHYSQREDNNIVDIGIDNSLIENERIYYAGNSFRMDHELFVFSDIDEKILVPIGNALMLTELSEETFVPDQFLHEQNLIITISGKTVLIAGCAHRGILNIVNRAAAHIGKMPDVVIGGFHLYSRHLSYCETDERVKELGTALLKTKAKYYTCHCTGKEAYDVLKEVMGNQVEYFSTGQIININ